MLFNYVNFKKIILNILWNCKFNNNYFRTQIKDQLLNFSYFEI